MDKKLYGVYFSPTANTKKTVLTICKAMNESGCAQLDVTPEDARKKARSFGSDDVLVMGVPVYGGRVPGCLDGFFEGLTGRGTPAVIVVTYGNREYDDALLELKDIMTGKGFVPVAAAAFVGVHSYTAEVGKARPNDADMQAMEAFGRRCAAVIDGMTGKEELTVKGNTPYREGMAASPLSPVTTDRCIRCRLCTASCPTAAIDVNPKITDGYKCIMCQACVRVCPVGARIMDSPDFDRTVAWLENNFAQIQKEPETFFAQ